MISVMTTRHAPATNRQPRWMTSIARIYCAFIHCPRIDIDPARPRERSCEFFDFSRAASNSHLILRSPPRRKPGRASRRMASGAVPALVLRDAMLRMAPQDEGSENGRNESRPVSYCVSWMRLTSAAYLAPYLSHTGFTASWKGFLSAIEMTLTP